MAYDKSCAKKDKWRIPENILFITALLGGGVGGLVGMQIFRHKRKKLYFYIIFTLSAALHLCLIYLTITKFILK